MRIPTRRDFTGQKNRWMYYTDPGNSRFGNPPITTEQIEKKVAKDFSSKIGRVFCSASMKLAGTLKSIEVVWSGRYAKVIGSVTIMGPKGKPISKKVPMTSYFDLDGFITASEEYIKYMKSLKDPMKDYYDKP
jgi:hypothetical protein